MQGVLKISEGSNLGIHAMAYLANSEGNTASVTQISHDLRVSKDHLGKVMQRLTHLGLVDSRRGPRGGFTLARDASSITLLEIVEAIDGPLHSPQCLLGQPVCAPGRCTLSGLSLRVHAEVRKALSGTMLSDLPAPQPGRPAASSG